MATEPQTLHCMSLAIGASTLSLFNDLTLSQPFGQHHELKVNFTLDDINKELGKELKGNIAVKDLSNDWLGQKLEMSLQSAAYDSGGTPTYTTEQSFTGVVTSVQVRMINANSTVVTLSASSHTKLLSTGTQTRSFQEKTLADIVNEVLEPYKSTLKAGVSPSFTGTIPYITQYNEEDFAFLQRLAAVFGEWFYFDGQQLIFGKFAQSKSKAAELEYGSNFFNMEYAMRVVPVNHKLAYYDYIADEKYEAKSKDESVKGLQDYAQLAISKSNEIFGYETSDIPFQGYTNASDLQTTAALVKKEFSNQLVVMEGTSDNMQLRLGALANIKDDIKNTSGDVVRTDSYGSFLITGISHSLDGTGSYRNGFEAISQDTDYPPISYPVFQPKAETQPAKVIDTNDPEQMGRVKVQFYWQKDGDSTPWSRVANLMSGDERGVYFVPEIDEVVFVDFELGNPDLPFVRGSMFTGSSLPGSNLFEKDNVIKGIITKGGNHIIIDDSNGKEAIRIYNKENQNEVILTLDGEPVISVKSEGKIKLEAKEIELKADKISMNAKQEWTVETNKGSIEAKAKMQIGGATVNIEGKSQTSIKGNAQLALEGGAQASLKAAMVMIN